MNQIILDVKNLTMRFGGLTAVDNVSFKLNANQILGIIGPNGAGKTTIFNAISGLYQPTSGEVLFNGQLINKLSPHEIAKIGLRRTFQQSRLFEDLSVHDNVLIGMTPQSSNDLLKAIVRRDIYRSETEANINDAIDLLNQFSSFLRN